MNGDPGRGRETIRDLVKAWALPRAREAARVRGRNLAVDDGSRVI